MQHHLERRKYLFLHQVDFLFGVRVRDLGAVAPTEDLYARVYKPTLPLDPVDPFRFAQLVETAKDAFQVELKRYFDYLSDGFARRKIELPTIEKYNLGFSGSAAPIETVTQILLQHPDILEKLPLVAITSATGQNLRLGLGTQLAASTQPPAVVRGTTTGPFALVDGDKLAFRTTPNNGPAVVSTVLFKSQLFVDITQATTDEVVAAARVQLLYVTVDQALYALPVGILRARAFGPIATQWPNTIEVLGPPYSTANALTQLGFVEGQSDSAVSHNPANRYQAAMNLTINLDIGTEDPNARRELTDLVFTGFFTLAMDERRGVFYGRSAFDFDFPDENFQVILLDKHSLAGEAEIPRGQDGRDKVFVNRISVPITVVDYVDRELVTLPRRGTDLDLQRSRVDEDGLPAGDHAEAGETSG